MKINRMLVHRYTMEEMQGLGLKLAEANQRKERLEDNKKQSMSQFKSEMDAQDAAIKALSQKLARGCEDRSVECEILFHTPEEGQKTIRRDDTGETVEIMAMTKNELEDLFINGIGAKRDDGEFVFRDKSRCRMVNEDEFEKLRKKGEFKKVGDGYTEKELVDDKPKNIEALVVVDCGDDEYELHQFVRALKQSDGSDGADKSDVKATKLLGDGAIDAEVIEDKNEPGAPKGADEE